jgi:hypothetical protein
VIVFGLWCNKKILKTPKEHFHLFQKVIQAFFEKKSTILTDLISWIYGHVIIFELWCDGKKVLEFFLITMKCFIW